ncbi:MAG TPA: GAF domain-containing protein [Thermoanaerobaculia bacterium]|nr:GAF domain-containing protein [Thermoanaerobaculia bacterium]
MPSSMELAARLSGVVSAQQEMLSVLNDPQQVMQLAVNRTPDVTNSAGAVVELAEGDQLVYRAASGPAARHLGLRIPMDDSISGSCIIEQRPIRCDDVDLDPRVNSAAARMIGIRSLIVAPLVHGGKAVGVLKTFSHKTHTFDDLDTYTLQLLAGMTSAALMEAHEIRARQASEERYRMLFERNVAGVFRTTLDGRILDCNDALASYLGYASREDLLKREVWDLYHQRSDRDKFIEDLKVDRALTNRRLQLRRKDGSSMMGLVTASIIPADSGESQVLGTMVEDS